ncbi:MAG: guanylate kinase [Candidatus Omnitrophica bacterium]|nr:guanylate kinase [Candidatus Omnitrophota bacterium]
MRRQGHAGRAKLFVISAPSGCGKTTLCNKLVEDNLGLVKSVSMTTRRARIGEADGVDYRFVSEKRFREIAKKDGFLEYENNFGHMYGTPRDFVEDNLKRGVSVLLSIDVKGAMKVRSAHPGDSVLIFLLPPSAAALKRRLRSRESEDRRSLSRRLGLAEEEMSYKDVYDYRIVNDRLDHAHKKLKDVITSESK